jgi:hypothetical protein
MLYGAVWTTSHHQNSACQPVPCESELGLFWNRPLVELKAAQSEYSRDFLFKCAATAKRLEIEMRVKNSSQGLEPLEILGGSSLGVVRVVIGDKWFSSTGRHCTYIASPSAGEDLPSPHLRVIRFVSPPQFRVIRFVLRPET